MSLFNHAQNTFVHGDITATQVNPTIYNAEVTNFVGAQNHYHGAPLKGVDLLHRHTSPAALLDSRARRDPPRCMEGTREAIIQEILDWLKKVTKSPSILWLRGPAGHGKTALEFTIAEICKREGLLIGSFFFSNRIANCSDGSLLFATLAAQLTQAFPWTKRYIDKAIRNDPHIFDKALETQMKALIVEPIQRIATMTRILDTVTFGWISYPTLIVIDGLDECVGLDVQDEIIRIVGDLVQQVGLPFRFLIASRPEPNLCKAFEKLQSRLARNSLSTMLLTEDALTRRDIQIYFEGKFSELRAQHSYLPAEWPGPDTIMRLVDKASGQFVYATTIIMYISSADDRPDDRLNVILKLLDTPAGDAPYAPLDQLYSYIVRSVKHRKEVLLILGQLILAKEMANEEDILGSTSQRRIEVTLNFRVGDVKRLLNSMHSVIDIGDNLKLLHASFHDFLLDPSRSNDFVVNLPEARTMLELAYFRAICSPPFSILISLDSAKKFNQIYPKCAGALKYCREAGILKQLSQKLNRADIIGEYESYVGAAPWKRYSATLVLKPICAMLTNGGYGRFNESDINAKLKAFWDAYTWEVVPNYGAYYSKVLYIRLRDRDPNFASAMDFLINLSDHKISPLSRQERGTNHIAFKSPNTNGVIIRFDLVDDIGVWKNLDGTIGFSFDDDTHHVIKVPYVCSSPGKEAEVQAWETLAVACLQCDRLK